jgi:hypothetical protein
MCEGCEVVVSTLSFLLELCRRVPVVDIFAVSPSAGALPTGTDIVWRLYSKKRFREGPPEYSHPTYVPILYSLVWRSPGAHVTTSCLRSLCCPQLSGLRYKMSWRPAEGFSPMFPSVVPIPGTPPGPRVLSPGPVPAPAHRFHQGAVPHCHHLLAPGAPGGSGFVCVWHVVPGAPSPRGKRPRDTIGGTGAAVKAQRTEPSEDE